MPRRIVPERPEPMPDVQQRLARLRANLDSERAAWQRWQSRMTRAFNAFMKLSRSITRIQREITKLSNP